MWSTTPNETMAVGYCGNTSPESVVSIKRLSVRFGLEELYESAFEI